MNPFSFALPDVNDRSVEILDQITGVTKYLITGDDSQVLHLTFNQMLKHFNEAMLGCSLIIFAILLFVGTINTASEGQFLGRNWDSTWTPLRIIIGILFVVPLKTGLCIGQYLFLYAILIGIHIATYVWNQVVDDIFKHYSPPAIPSYVANYAQQVAENQMILTAMAQIQQKVFNGAGACDIPGDQAPYVTGTYAYLLSNNISPAWADPEHPEIMNNLNQNIHNYVQSHGAPAGIVDFVTTRVYNGARAFIMQGGDGQKPLSDFDPCASPSSTVSVNIPVDATYNAGSSTNPVPTVVGSIFTDNQDKLCGLLYPNDSSVQSSCRTTVNAVLSAGAKGNSRTGQEGAFDGQVSVFMGSNVNSTKGIVVGNCAIDAGSGAGMYCPTETGDTWQPDGQIHMTGQYTYSFTAGGTSGAPAGATDANTQKASAQIKDDLKKQLDVFINNKIMAVGSPGANLCLTSDSDHVGCSLSPMANTILALAQQTVENLPNQVSSNPDCKMGPVTDLAGNPIMIPQVDENGRAVMKTETDKDGKLVTVPVLVQATEVQCPFSPDLATYEVKGMPYIDDAGVEHHPIIEVPLKGSWWNAGESYLILDDHFASNIKVLVDAVQQNMVNLVGGESVSGQLTVETGIGIMVASTHMTMLQGPGDVLAKQCNKLENGTYVCALGNTMLLPSQDIKLTSTKVDLSDMGDTGTWGSVIAPYNPQLAPKDANGQDNPMYKYYVPGVTSQFYQQLLEVPSTFRVPLQLILIQAKNASDSGAPGCANDGGNCFVTVYPYLQNILNVLAANGILSNSQEVLPVNQAMNSMFTQLLGSQDANDPRIRSINSVMQDVYNFGVDRPGDILSQQFSLIQQVRDTGISMIVACLGAMQEVYTHYRLQMDALISNVDAQIKGPTAVSAQALAGASAGLFVSAGTAAMAGWPGIATGIGFLGQSASATSQILQSQVELSIATTTITTMSNIGIQLMWLPLFLFVMTSLLTAGVQFALVVPFMPYIMFWAGQMAWVIGVLEALIAAPLVMLAFAHPGGQGYMGHAGGAMRFLIGIIFRPVLMVIGLITGILLTYVLIHYSAEGFHIIAGSVFNSLPAYDTNLMGVMSCLLLFTYASFLVMAFTKCFSPIYVIPEKVVQWINGQTDQAGAQEAQQFGSNVQQTAQSGAQAGGSSMQQGIQAQQTKGQQMSDLGKQQFSQGLAMSATSKAAEAGKEGASSAIQFRVNQKG